MAAAQLEIPCTVSKQMAPYTSGTSVPGTSMRTDLVRSSTAATSRDDPEPHNSVLAALSMREEDALFGSGRGQQGGADGGNDAYQSYLQDIRGFTLLSHEDETTLAKRSAAGDLRAQRCLVEANLRLVVVYAQWYMRSGVPLIDLIQEGNIGLMRAAQKFDWRRGVRFSTYATWWIRQAIRRAAGEQSRLIHVPEHVAERAGKVRRVGAQMAQEMRTDPTSADIAQASGLPVEAVEALLHLPEQPSSLDDMVDGERGLALADTLPDSGILSPEESAARHDLSEEMHAGLRHLTLRERSAVLLRYGIQDGQSRTLREVSMQLGISRERARQLIERALAKLRESHSMQSLIGMA